MNIGEKIKLLRTKLDLTQEELATAAETTKQTIHKYETGIITNIPASKIKALADKLGTTPAYLMGWEEQNEQTTIPNKINYENLTSDEKNLLDNYGQLNNEGKDKVREYVSDLTTMDKYTTLTEPCLFDGVRVMGENDSVTRIAAFGGGVSSNDDKVKHT